MPTEMYDEDEVEEARQEGYEEGYADGIARKPKQGGTGKRHTAPTDDGFHFHIHVDDLANAIYNGVIPSRSVNGAGSRTDARLQAEAMLAACGMLQ